MLHEIVAAHYSQIFKIRNGYHWYLSVADSPNMLELSKVDNSDEGALREAQSRFPK